MPKKKKVLFLCTGNACRSQIAHGLLNDLSSSNFEVFSAGLQPSQVHPISIAVMEEIGINISNNSSDHVDDYLNIGIDIVITVCHSADKNCPKFPENTERIHWNIEDPFKNWNFDLNQLNTFRKTRNNINSRVINFIKNHKLDKL